MFELLIGMINIDNFWKRKGIKFEMQKVFSKRHFYKAMKELESYDLVLNENGVWYLTRPKGFFIAKMLRDGVA